MKQSDANLVRSLLRSDLHSFTHKVFKTVSPADTYLPNWHVKLICEYLRACEQGKINRLIINIPPRFMKSIAVSVAFPAWLLGHHPEKQIMCASYGMALSYKHSMDTRFAMRQDWYKSLFPKTVLGEDVNTKSKFVTTSRGFRLATSIGSAVTGSGADYLIVDDPLNADGAHSPVAVEAANNWFDQVFSTRLNNPKKGVIIVIMQRLHENDLTGHLLAKGGWTHLNVPLIAEKDHVYKMGKVVKEVKKGDLLHPERVGNDEVEKLKTALGPYAFAGQYQQSPAPAGGGVFKVDWLKYYKNIDYSNMNLYIFVDPANAKGKRSDYTAITVIGAASDGNLYVVDMIRDRLDAQERENTVFDLHKKYRPLCIYIEKYGMQVDIDYIRYAMERRNYRFNVRELGGTMSKESRIRRLEALFASGRIWFPESGIYKPDGRGGFRNLVQEFIDQEYLTFPLGTHDDMLDSMARVCDITPEYPGGVEFDYYGFARGFK